jgi:glyceraldehyde-3-phosphate dehydrogenase (NADP+)
VAEIAECGPTDLEEAIAAAAAVAPSCRKLPSYTRARVCTEVAQALAQRKDALAESMVLEAGKPIADARGEVDRAVYCFELAASEVERLSGESMPLDLTPASPGRLGITRRVPVGPVGAISPFNFPINLAVHKVAPAIAAGCPVVLKPAPQTPTACLILAEAIDATSWPKGALSVVPSAPQVADVLVTDERIRLLSFTGSAKVGWDMKRRAGRKKVVLELGDTASVIVEDDAALDYAIPRIVYGGFSYAGQKCISVQRILVREPFYKKFTERLVDATRKVKAGDPRDPSVLVGPLINEGAARRIETWIEEAKAGGAEVLLGGPRQGNVIPPTILTNVPREAKVCTEEVFGPVVVLEPYRAFEDAVAQVNRSDYGLQTGVFTERIDRALAAFEELEVGGVILNDVPTYRSDAMPYGGVKNSGFGREGIKYAIEDMTEIRVLVINQSR